MFLCAEPFWGRVASSVRQGACSKIKQKQAIQTGKKSRFARLMRFITALRISLGSDCADEAPRRDTRNTSARLQVCRINAVWVPREAGFETSGVGFFSITAAQSGISRRRQFNILSAAHRRRRDGDETVGPAD